MPVAKTDYFWTDPQQASERLQNSVVMYDGQPVYVVEIIEADPSPKASIIFCADQNQTRLRKLLNSPKFNKFRDLPKLGFMNKSNSGVVLLERRIRTTRQHGLTGDNVYTRSFRFTATGASNAYLYDGPGFRSCWPDVGFQQMQENDYPSLASVLSRLPSMSSAAISPLFAVTYDNAGFRMLWRHDKPIGIFVDNTTLMTPRTASFLREEIIDSAVFRGITLKEY